MLSCLKLSINLISDWILVDSCMSLWSITWGG
jgi:hypothetical protein